MTIMKKSAKKYAVGGTVTIETTKKPVKYVPTAKEKKNLEDASKNRNIRPTGPKNNRLKPKLGDDKGNIAKNGKSFPDLNKDGKVTKADILKGRGVIAKKGAVVKKAVSSMKKCKYGCK